MKIISVSSPAFTPITIDMANSFLKLRPGDDDTFVKQLINASIDEVEDITNFSLASKTYVELQDKFSQYVFLSKVNATEITSIQYLDDTDTYQTLNSSFYELITILDSAQIKFLKDKANFPTILSKPGTLKITYKAGPLTQGALKASYLVACYIYIGHFYENRQALEAPEAFYKYLASMRFRSAI